MRIGPSSVVLAAHALLGPVAVPALASNEYDSGAFDQYDEWLAREDACWDETGQPRLDLPDHYSVELAINRAQIKIKCRTFRTDDVMNWTYVDRCDPSCDAAVGFTLQDQSGDFVRLSCLGYRRVWPEPSCGAAVNLNYSIRGEPGDENDVFVTWTTTEAAPWPAPEPGTLGLLGLGLVGLGLCGRLWQYAERAGSIMAGTSDGM